METVTLKEELDILSVTVHTTSVAVSEFEIFQTYIYIETLGKIDINVSREIRDRSRS